MLPRREIEWDVLFHPRLDMWFETLRTDGWYRDINTPGVKTPQGTIVYKFHHLAHVREETA